MEDIIFITVTMEISNKFPPIDKKWNIKFERDIIQYITTNVFQFSSSSMNVAVTKVADLVARHPENYFKSIIIN